VDEISQLDVGLWLQINKLTNTKMQFLLSGDFHQFPALGNTFRGAVVSDTAFEHSGLLHTLCSGNRVTLTTCRRSDVELFAFYSSLIEGGSRYELTLQEAVKQAKAQFKYSSIARHNLVISHQRRIRINRELNEQEAPPDAVRLEVTGKAAHGNGAQTMLLYPGLQLIGSVSAEKKGVRNGCLYTVASVGGDKVRLAGLEATFSYEQVKLWLRLSYAQTYASCQGTEFEGALRLWDVAHRHFSKRHLFVGLSRAKLAAAVGVKD
jgi:hypothetical protein